MFVVWPAHNVLLQTHDFIQILWPACLYLISWTNTVRKEFLLVFKTNKFHKAEKLKKKKT